ncbi:ABC-type transport auxiliary lipoprotein family protein [Roseococcus sp. DSY-14]|uniref:ABC-type transport auxiliary lipoprotein family protein n=1 Tax=Roseococcus sp. DSY-14 TaxID=3369650 RepID=UPI00387AAD08
MNRRALLPLPLLLAGCGLSRPYVETRRYPLDPRREGPPRRSGREALLLRPLRAGAGLDGRGLRRLRPDGSVEVAPYDEWLAPPADLAEAALREWLGAAQVAPAITAAGSRLAAPLVLEAELLRLEVVGTAARARLAALLLRDVGGLGNARVLAQAVLESESPVSPEAGWAGAAAACRAALAEAFARLEAWLVSSITPSETSRR